MVRFTSEPWCSLGRGYEPRTNVETMAMSNFSICGEANRACPIRSLVTMLIDLPAASPLNKSVIGDRKVAKLKKT